MSHMRLKCLINMLHNNVTFIIICLMKFICEIIALAVQALSTLNNVTLK